MTRGSTFVQRSQGASIALKQLCGRALPPSLRFCLIHWRNPRFLGQSQMAFELLSSSDPHQLSPIDILSDIYSDTTSGSLFGILSDIYSHILSDILLSGLCSGPCVPRGIRSWRFNSGPCFRHCPQTLRAGRGEEKDEEKRRRDPGLAGGETGYLSLISYQDIKHISLTNGFTNQGLKVDHYHEPWIWLFNTVQWKWTSIKRCHLCQDKHTIMWNRMQSQRDRTRKKLRTCNFSFYDDNPFFYQFINATKYHYQISLTIMQNLFPSPACSYCLRLDQSGIRPRVPSYPKEIGFRCHKRISSEHLLLWASYCYFEMICRFLRMFPLY